MTSPGTESSYPRPPPIVETLEHRRLGVLDHGDVTVNISIKSPRKNNNIHFGLRLLRTNNSTQDFVTRSVDSRYSRTTSSITLAVYWYHFHGESEPACSQR